MFSHTITRSRPRQPAPAVLALVTVLVAGLVLRAWVVSRGWFYWDDLILLAQARESGLGDLLLRPHDGHLMPGSWLMIWLFAAAVEGLNWPAAVAALVVGQTAAAGAVAYAAWRIRPQHAWWVTAIYLLIPLALPTSTWLAAAVNSLPLHTAAAVWLAHGWLHLTRGRTSDAVAAAAAVAAAGLFSERVVLLAPATLLLLLVWAPGARHRVTLAAGLLAPSVAWAGVYLAAVGDPRLPGGDPGSAGQLIAHGYLRAFLPTLAGGPWSWDRWHPGPPFAAPSAPAVLAGLLACAGLLWWAGRQCGGRGILAAGIVLAYPLLPFLALAVARSGGDTAAEITQTLRHFAEVSVPLALTCGVLAGRPGGRPGGLPRGRYLVALALLVVLTVSSLVSTAAYARSWSQQPAREYFTTLSAGLAQREQPILDQAVPLEVLLPVAHPYNRLSALLGEPRISQVTSDPALADRHGNLVPAELFPLRATGSEPGCAEGELAVPLDGPLLERDWVLRLNYLAENPGEASVSLDGESVGFPVEQGLNQVHVSLHGGGDALLVAADGLCLGRSEVGLLAPSR